MLVNLLKYQLEEGRRTHHENNYQLDAAAKHCHRSPKIYNEFLENTLNHWNCLIRKTKTRLDHRLKIFIDYCAIWNRMDIPPKKIQLFKWLRRNYEIWNCILKIYGPKLYKYPTWKRFHVWRQKKKYGIIINFRVQMLLFLFVSFHEWIVDVFACPKLITYTHKKYHERVWNVSTCFCSM